MAVSAALLQRFSPFDSLDERQLETIASYAQVETIPKGTFVIKRGKELKTITYLISGQVDLVDASFNSQSVYDGSERCVHALTRESPSGVSAIAKSDAEILNVDHQAFELLKEWSQDPDLAAPSNLPPLASGVDEGDGKEDWMGHLLDSPLFSQVPPTQLQQLFARFESMPVNEGETIVEESAEGDYFYVIESGQAVVRTRFDGEVASLGPGRYFGEEALVGETIRNASVVMRSAGMLMRLNKEDFKVLLQEALIRYIDGEHFQKHVLAGENWQLLDVRLPIEYRIAHVKDSANVPLGSLRKRMADLDHNATYVVSDDAGKRSEVAAHLLCQAGFTTYILENSADYYS